MNGDGMTVVHSSAILADIFSGNVVGNFDCIRSKLIYTHITDSNKMHFERKLKTWSPDPTIIIGEH